jgi:SAM-dependent methyltransferase
MVSPHLIWHVPAALLESEAVENRNAFARNFESAPLGQILETYTKLDLARARQLIAAGEKAVLPARLRGVGLELGAGTALLSSALAGRPEIEKVYAVEVVPEMVSRIQKRVVESLLPPAARAKVCRTRGSFDHLELPEESADFILELASWHHSDDLKRTLAEAARVLKKGGVALAFDRIQPDQMTDQQVDALLDQVYPRDFLEKMGYPPGIRLTRRVNGEHEYRRREWLAAFAEAGFEVLAMVDLERRAEPPLKSLARLAHLAAGRRKIGSPGYELKLWLSQLRRGTPKSPTRTTAIGLVKIG